MSSMFQLISRIRVCVSLGNGQSESSGQAVNTGQRWTVTRMGRELQTERACSIIPIDSPRVAGIIARVIGPRRPLASGSNRF